VSYPYSTTITCVVPLDTVSIVTWTVDSIGVTGMNGLPAGFSYATNTASGYWHGGTKGCMLISGTATSGEIGIHRLKIYTKTYVTNSTLGNQTQLDTAIGYRINIQDSVLAGINNGNEQGGISFIVNTDPYYNSINVKIHSESLINDASIIIYDITGRELMHLNDLNGNDFMINKGNLSNGIYIISLISEQKIIARRKFIIG
jgi:hypothetical protein